MGQRGARAAFMPEMFVFPGGARRRRTTSRSTARRRCAAETAARLAVDTAPELVPGLARAAVRELWEETGLVLGRPDPGAAGRTVPEGWREFFAAGVVPHTAPLRFVFRAITPPGRPRRFDARFFLADAAVLAPGGRTTSRGRGELRPPPSSGSTSAAARALPLPFITEVVLSEVEALLAEPARARGVPDFHQRAEEARFRLL